MTSYLTPKTTISEDIAMEARRLLYLAAKLPQGTLQNRGFLVLPELGSHTAQNTIVFPDLDYAQIPDFWYRTSRLQLATPIDAPAKLLAETIELIRPIYDLNLYQTHIKSLKKTWESIESKFWHNLFTLFPQYQNMIDQVNIYSTQFGPYSTFSIAKNGARQITIFLRQDSGVDRLLWTLITCLFRPKMQYEQNYSWEEIQALVDWFMAESSLNCGYPMEHPSIRSLRMHESGREQLESQKYLAHLGLAGSAILTKKGSNYEFAGLKIADLTVQDQLLLEVMLTKRGFPVSFEEIATTLWPQDEDWTLYAVVKAIQRLRLKIKAAGINLPVVRTHRKVGYSII